MLHEHWRDYTEEEINEIKKRVCIDNDCPYLKYFNGGGATKCIDLAYCDYLIMAGKHPPRAEVCEHYKDQNVKQVYNDKTFLTREEHEWIKEMVPNVGNPDHYRLTKN